MKKLYTRRKFLKTISGAGLYIATSPLQSLASQKNPYINYDFSRDPEEITVARVTCGECEEILLEEDNIEPLMIIHTMINRANNQFKFDGKTPKEAALMANPIRRNKTLKKDKNGYTIFVHQYSCLNAWDPNLKKIKNPEKYYPEKLWKKAIEKSTKTLEGKLDFANLGQTHYFRKGSRKPNFAKDPRYERVWSPEDSKHFFYRDTKAKIEENLYGLV